MKNISPHGWYVGSYILRFIQLTADDNQNPEHRFTTWENTVIVKANSLGEAYDKVTQIAAKETTPYQGGPNGIDVQWIFEGITDLLPIYEELQDGAEIMWTNNAPRKLKNIRKQIKQKSDLINSPSNTGH